LRSTIALLPALALLALGIAGCDRPKDADGQANATVPTDSDAAPANETAPTRADKLDRSHKGEAAPATPFKAPDGKTVTLADFKGKPLLLNLWATWCAPCVREMPTLDRVAVRESGKLQVLTVSQDLEGAAKVTPFFEKARFKALKPYLDTDVALSTGYGVNLPTTILYDSQGREIWRVAGDMEWDSATAAAWIAEAK
jgi:thiol-disulfide isomerase/thioredoxin